MDEAHKELVKRLKRTVCRSDWDVYANPDGVDAALALEALAGEVERLTTNGIHTCHDNCPRLACVQGREIRALTAERDRLKAALEAFVDPPLKGHEQLAILNARKALGDAA